ncbi:MAG: aspartate kinase [Spirochaetales bacterium]|nr:aspartate kinase [Spirochaetales bacterium]
MIVMKFGGTSVAGNTQIDNVLDIAKTRLDAAPVLVSSAMAKVTDGLIRISELASAGKKEEADKETDDLIARHIDVAKAFLSGDNLVAAIQQINKLCGEFESLVRGMSLLKECSDRSYDKILSFGELLSTTLIYFRALERGFDAEFLDSRDFIKTDDNFTCAAVDFAETNAKIKEIVKPKTNKLLIAQGFIGSTDEGVTATLGRGGSDYTAAIIGAALDAKVVEIWTDVSGIMTTDPRIIAEARTIDKMTYQEAAELAFFGAKVVHPSTMQPVIEKQIPITVLNSLAPESAYTEICSEVPEKGLKAITKKKGIILVNITSSRMLNAYGFLSKIFSVFEKYKTSVDLIATSEVSVSMTIDSEENLDEIKSELSNIGVVKIEKDKSIISMVGQELWKDPNFISDVFKAAGKTEINMISMGSSETNLGIVVNEANSQQTIIDLHKLFFN